MWNWWERVYRLMVTSLFCCCFLATRRQVGGMKSCIGNYQLIDKQCMLECFSILHCEDHVKPINGQGLAGWWANVEKILTLARFPYFATFASRGGRGATPPHSRFETKLRRAKRKKTADCSRRVLAIGGGEFFFILGQYLIQLWEANWVNGADWHRIV